MTNIRGGVAVWFAAVVVAAFVATGALHGAVLFTPPGDGSLSVGVDAYGSFGSSIGGGGGASDLIYNPVGAIGASGTTFESGLAIGFGGARTFLSTGDIGGSGNLANPGFGSTSNTQATSSFSFGGLSFALNQVVSEVFDGGNRIGSRLDQTYSITNNSAAVIAFELVRYLDGDLLFDGSISDGGGRLDSAGNTIYFETDAGGSGSTSTTFLGILLAGGTTPATGKFDIRSFASLRSNIIAGAALLDQVVGDNNNDGFIDAGNTYDVTLGVRRTFSLAPGASTTATTVTFAGTGPPAQVIANPEPMAVLTWVVVAGVGVATAKWSRLRRRAG